MRSQSRANRARCRPAGRSIVAARSAGRNSNRRRRPLMQTRGRAAQCRRPQKDRERESDTRPPPDRLFVCAIASRTGSTRSRQANNRFLPLGRPRGARGAPVRPASERALGLREPQTSAERAHLLPVNSQDLRPAGEIVTNSRAGSGCNIQARRLNFLFCPKFSSNKRPVQLKRARAQPHGHSTHARAHSSSSSRDR